MAMEASAGAIAGTSGPTIGRGAELARLSAILTQVRSGRPRIVALRGEAGVGKSHLLREVVARARALEFLVGVGHGQEGVAVPYLSAAEALQRCAENLPPNPGRAPPHELLQHILEAAASRAPRLLEIAERAIELAAEHPLLLAIDDFQWADDDSRQLFTQLGFALSDAATRSSVAVLLAIVTRSGDAGAGRARGLQQLLREPICEAIDVAGLDLLDTTALLRAHGLSRPSPAAAQSIFAVTAGNPLFIRGLAAQSLRTAPASTADLVATALAPDLAALVAAQIDAAPSELLRLLRRAALIGQRFSLALLAQVVRAGLEDVIDALGRAPEFVRLDGEHGEFAHPLIRHELSQRLPAPLRAELHGEIADALAAASPDAETRGDPAFAHHLVSAGARATPARVLAVSRSTAQRLEAMRAFAEAARFYTAAAEREPDTRLRAELWFHAGHCHQSHYDAAACMQAFAHAHDAYRALGDVCGEARVAVERARVELYTTPLGQLRDLSALEQALQALPPGEEVLEGWLQCALADGYFYARRSEDGERHARRALELGERHRDHRLCRFARIPLGLSLAQSMRYIEAEQCYAAAIEHAHALGDPRVVVVPRVRRAGVLHGLGRLDEAIAECSAAIDAAACTSEPGEEAFALAHLAGIVASRGEFDRGEQLVHAMVRLLGRVDGRPWAPLLGIPALAYVRHARGQWDDARVALQALREPGRWVDKVGGAEHVLSTALEDLIAAAAGAPKDDQAAGARRARVERYAARISPRSADGMGLCAVCALAELAIHYQLPWALEGPHAVLAQAFASGARFSTGWPFSIARVLGNAELAFGRAADAERYYEAALDVASRSGAVAELAHARLDYARALLSRGGAPAEQRARELLAPALEELAQLGMEPLLRRARNLAEALGGLPPQRASQPIVPRADVQMLLQLAGSEASADVSQRYLLSERGLRARTADVFAALGARRPLDLARYVFEQGLVPPPRSHAGLPLALMVTDLEGFTPLVERLGDTRAQQLIREHNALLRAQLRDHSGLEITHTGDGLIASFGSVAEAAGCAIAIQREVAKRNRHAELPLHLRIGLHMGEPLLEEGRLFGVAVIAAVRICAESESNHILASRLVQLSAGPLQLRFAHHSTRKLKGFSEATELYDVSWQSQ